MKLNRNFDSALDVAIVIVFNWIDKPQYYATWFGSSFQATIHISEQFYTNVAAVG